MSTQRLDKGSELYNQGVSKHIFALGGHYSTYSPNALCFDKSGAELRKEYLVSKGVAPEGVIKVEDGCRDTIGEAFSSRQVALDNNFSKLLVVTSDKHLERSLYTYKRIFGSSFTIDVCGVPCGDLLSEEDEKEQPAVVKELFDKLPVDIPSPKSWLDWYNEHKETYDKQTEIHKKYKMMGKNISQAYTGVIEP